MLWIVQRTDRLLCTRYCKMLLTHPENLRIDEVNNYGHLYVPLFELYGASVGVWFYPDEDLETP